jgi:hypothetical protein
LEHLLERQPLSSSLTAVDFMTREVCLMLLKYQLPKNKNLRKLAGLTSGMESDTTKALSRKIELLPRNSIFETWYTIELI